MGSKRRRCRRRPQEQKSQPVTPELAQSFRNQRVQKSARGRTTGPDGTPAAEVDDRRLTPRSDLPYGPSKRGHRRRRSSSDLSQWCPDTFQLKMKEIIAQGTVAVEAIQNLEETVRQAQGEFQLTNMDWQPSTTTYIIREPAFVAAAGVLAVPASVTAPALKHGRDDDSAPLAPGHGGPQAFVVCEGLSARVQHAGLSLLGELS